MFAGSLFVWKLQFPSTILVQCWAPNSTWAQRTLQSSTYMWDPNPSEACLLLEKKIVVSTRFWFTVCCKSTSSDFRHFSKFPTLISIFKAANLRWKPAKPRCSTPKQHGGFTAGHSTFMGLLFFSDSESSSLRFFGTFFSSLLAPSFRSRILGGFGVERKSWFWTQRKVKPFVNEMRRYKQYMYVYIIYHLYLFSERERERNENSVSGLSG